MSSRLFYSVKSHDQIATTSSIIPGEDDRAVRFDEIMKEFKAKFDGVSQWSINDWMSFLNNTDLRTLRNIFKTAMP